MTEQKIPLRSRSNVNEGNFYYFLFPPAICGLKNGLQLGNETIPKSGKNGHSTFCKVANKCKWSTIAHFGVGRTQIMVYWKCIDSTSSLDLRLKKDVSLEE